MALKGSKHKTDSERKVIFTPSSGLNYSVDPSSLPDNQCPVLYNFLYERDGMVPVTRPALKAVTLDATTADIDVVYHWVKDSTTEYTVMISDSELYYLDRVRAGLSAWATATSYVVGNERKNDSIGYTCIADHTSSATDEPGVGINWETYWREDPVWIVQNTAFAVDSAYRPQFLAFNQRLLIAAGTEGLLYWNGPEDYGQITTGVTTIHPTAIIEIANRVVINNVASGGYDSVYFSTVEDEEGWTFTSVGGAVLLRADYGRGFQANSFGIFGDDLIVSLSSSTAQKLVRINIAGDAYTDTAVSWRIEKLFYETGAVGNGLMVSLDKQVLFVSQNGLEAVTGTDESYSELAAARIGLPVNRVLASYVPSEIRLIPVLGSVWVLFSDVSTVFVFHPWGAGFSEIYFQERISSITQRGTDVLISKGKYLYKLDESSASDEVVGGTDVDVYSILRTKRIETNESSILIKRVEVNFVAYTTGTLYLDYVSSSDSNPIQVTNVAIGESSPLIYNDLYTWEDDFVDQTFDFVGSNYPSALRSYSKMREQDFTLQLRVNGRCKINNIYINYVELEG